MNYKRNRTDDLVGFMEVSGILCVSYQTAAKLAKEGAFGNIIRVGTRMRVSRSSVEEYINRKSSAPIIAQAAAHAAGE